MGAPFPPLRRSPLFRKAALVPLWILQLVVMCGIIGIQVYLGTTNGSHGLGGPETLIFMSLSAFSAILTIIEIAIFAAHKLRPLPYLLLQLVKLTIWLTMLGLWGAALSVGQSTTKTRDFIIPLIETVLPVLAFLTSSLYASITYHRHRPTPLHRQRQRIFSLESGRYPEVNEKTLERNVWPASSPITTGELHHQSKYHHQTSALNSPTLVNEIDATGHSPLSPYCRQELGDEGWVGELDCEKGVQVWEWEVRRAEREREVFELAAVRTPRGGRSKRGSCGDEVGVGNKVRSRMGSRKGRGDGSRARLSEALSPKTRSRRVSRDAAGSGKMGRGRLSETLSPKTRSRKGSRDELDAGSRPKTRSRKGSRDDSDAVSRPKTRVQRMDKRTMW